MGLNKGYLQAKTDKASDEVYTARYAVIPIEKYLKPNSIIWCPFDMEDSEYVKYFEEIGHKVIHSHIDEDLNFFEFEPEEDYDYIISNPPFSVKDMVIKKNLSMAHARSLSKLSDQNLQIEIANKIVKDGMSVRELEKIVNNENYEKTVYSV